VRPNDDRPQPYAPRPSPRPAHEPGRGWQEALVVGVPLFDHLPSPGIGAHAVGLHEDLTEQGHSLDLPDPHRGVVRPDGPAQGQRVLAEDLREPLPPGLRARHRPAVDPWSVPFGELGNIDHAGQPGRRRIAAACPGS